MKQDHIFIKGAGEHNLCIDELRIPKHKLVVFSGVSGSGKSSLAFDTLYAEGQRRYVESLSSYARQFLGQLEKPKYEKLRGLSPTIAIEQKAASSNPRSTVGTITEVYDYMRVLWARTGTQYCHLCGREVAAMTSGELVDEILELPSGTRAQILSPLIVERKGEHRDTIAGVVERGFVRMRIDGVPVRLDEDLPSLAKTRKHTLELIVDRIVVGNTARERLADSVETALRESGGDLVVTMEDGEEKRFSSRRYCVHCKVGFSELSPQSFSFNSPLGACSSCNGLGTRLEISPDLLVPNPNISIYGGAILPWAQMMKRGDGWNVRIFEALERDFDVDLDMKWKDLPKWQRELILFGTGGDKIKVKWQRGESSGTYAMRFEGVANTMLRRLHQTNSNEMREYYQQYLSDVSCSECDGEKLKSESRSVMIGGKSISRVTAMSVKDAQAWFDELELTGSRAAIAEEVLKEIGARLGFLANVGLSYLTLDRLGPTLSGGEAQRIRLASQLGSELSGVMYVLDEPSIGLHPRDDARLLDALCGLRDLGNSVIVVEHDRDTIERADHVVDFGPGAGTQGGLVISQGTPKQISKDPKSITGQYLSGKKSIPIPKIRRKPKKWLRLEGATLNNLKNVTCDLPLGVFAVFTGVSGAGKSSLLSQTILPVLERKLNRAVVSPGPHAGVSGIEHLDKIIHINQRPIGRTPRSNPATYTKAFDEIRKLMATTTEARAFGYKPGRFSFNVRGGRCEACGGAGVIKVEMHFLADVHVPCEVCRGLRYNDATLRVRFKGFNIREILDMTVSEALEVFAAVPKLKRILQTLEDVGMGYVQLGQQATTLSGGEAQRIKLSRELAKRGTGRTLYVLDEPTTGLHFDDIKKLLEVLDRLVDQGNTVAVIEHNLDVIKCADWVIDMGPGGGADGGRIIARGTPEQVAKRKRSDTAAYLKKILG
ncbi:MAG: excinuclease ABC subunit UvrA [Deltaproteobacteria bacterium]|nr:excinuclease ABC subunit UvrA [Deltaproteobacteria bacterium]